MLFKQTVAVYYDNYTLPVAQNADLLIVQAGGT
jgi:hypothetical protein